MKKSISVLMFFVFCGLGFAQITSVKSELKKIEVKPKDSIDGWKKAGTLSLQGNQTAFSNWVAGGENSVAANLNLNYNIHYKKGPWTWDNLLLAGYGIASTKSEGARKTDDRLEINTIVGRNAFGYWSYSFFANLRTQMLNGYNYNLDEDKDYPTSGLFKPAYLTFGPGLLWRESDNLNFNLAPLTSKVTILGGEVYTFKDLNNDGVKEAVSSNDTDIYGIDAGESFRYELGFYASGYYKVDIMENMAMENILSLYSNYLDEPTNVDLDYTMNLVMKINKYLSTNLTVQMLYDDDAYAGLQVREVFGLGVNVNL